jgi:hypothetical protein
MKETASARTYTVQCEARAEILQTNFNKIICERQKKDEE